jgi:hypothetical protein
MYYHGPYTKCNLLLLESPVMLCRLDDKLENEFETDMTDSYSIVVWFGVSHLLHVHDTDVFERVSHIDVDIPIQAV